VDTLSWRAIFFINVPIALLTLALAFRHVPGRSRDTSDGRTVDWVGGVLVTLGLAGLAYGLTAAPDSGWTDPLVLGGIIGGMLIIALFIRHEAATPLPILPLELFRSAVFSGANAMTLLLYFALGGVMFFLPFNLIQVQGYSATLAGAAFLPFTLIMGGMSRWSGGLVARYGARKPLTIGPIIAATGFALFAVPGRDASYWATFFPAMAVLGLGMAVSVAPLTTTVMGAVKEQHSGTASGINNAVARIAGMLAIALLGALATSVFRSALDTHVARLQVPAEIRVALDAEVPKLAEAKVPPQVVGEQRRALEDYLNEAFVRSFRIVMLVAAGFALTSALCAFLTVGSRHKAPR
jgi:MFS family permease